MGSKSLLVGSFLLLSLCCPLAFKLGDFSLDKLISNSMDVEASPPRPPSAKPATKADHGSMKTESISESDVTVPEGISKEDQDLAVDSDDEIGEEEAEEDAVFDSERVVKELPPTVSSEIGESAVDQNDLNISEKKELTGSERDLDGDFADFSHEEDWMPDGEEYEIIEAWANPEIDISERFEIEEYHDEEFDAKLEDDIEYMLDAEGGDGEEDTGIDGSERLQTDDSHSDEENEDLEFSESDRLHTEDGFSNEEKDL